MLKMHKAASRVLFASSFVSCFYSPLLSAEAAPAVQLANQYAQNSDLSLQGYWFAEKLDGIRGYWNGHQLLTRQGYLINAPSWFIELLPNIHLEGELWLGRGEFEELSSIVRQSHPDERWRSVRFVLFDMPHRIGSFIERRRELERLVDKLALAHVATVEIYPFTSKQELDDTLDLWTGEGAEGIILYQGASIYSASRSDALLKYKRYEDAEARVIGYQPGKGQFEGLVGALIVESADGRQFKLGSGLTLKDRQTPPEIGSQVTYRFNGLTRNGKPRFARFYRVRNFYE